MALSPLLLVHPAVQPLNLSVHFPFCRRKCAYCALKSRAGVSEARRAAYVARLADEIRARPERGWRTVYFGGGTPALSGLGPVLDALHDVGLAADAEFTVELHPADVHPALLDELAEGGVNRISLGVQSFDDAMLAQMGRTHSSADAMAAFGMVQRFFPNSGFDLIAGYPRPPDAAPVRKWLPQILDRLRPAHVSVYSLIREAGTRLDLDVRNGRLALPDDDEALDEISDASRILADAGLARYETSNYARAGFECRHNCAVWRGEDYVGLGDGAHGREGMLRTVGEGDGYSRETLSPQADALEREMFALRTVRGIDPDAAVRRRPALAPLLERWHEELDFAVAKGLAVRKGAAYVLTPRGMEVCDAILERLMPVADAYPPHTLTTPTPTHAHVDA